MRHAVRVGAAGAAVLGLLVALGPRVEMDLEVPPADLPPGSPAELADILAARESALGDVTPGAEKHVVFARPDAPAATPLAVVYLHGFSATRQEVSPLAELLADSLGANLFLTRLTGHGRGSDAMAEATLNDWLRDVEEALAVGGRLGERIVLMGTSTGGTLALWAAARPRWRSRLAGVLLVSPNLGLPDPRARILLWPWGAMLARAVEGPERSFEPRNALQERYWTTRYPTEALLPMMAAVKVVEETPLGAVEAPTLIAYDPDDRVVDPRKTERRFPDLGSPRKRLQPMSVPQGADAHVIAGDILNPALTLPLLTEMLDFLRGAGVEAGFEGGAGPPLPGPEV
jgi:alpha-beta hydrolase superfamily lysophospholipase